MNFGAKFGAIAVAGIVEVVPVLFYTANMNQTGSPVTIGDLLRDSKMLEVGCIDCGHWCYLDPRELPFIDCEPVPTLYRRMRCRKFGLKGRGYSRPDARVGGMGS